MVPTDKWTGFTVWRTWPLRAHDSRNLGTQRLCMNNCGGLHFPKVTTIIALICHFYELAPLLSRESLFLYPLSNLGEMKPVSLVQ